MSVVAVKLYGGALESALVGDFLDSSKIREIPDHQEVFIWKDNSSSLIFEIVNYESQVNDLNAAQHFFSDYVDSEDFTIVESRPASTTEAPNFNTVILVRGRQSASKSVPHDVSVMMAIARIPGESYQ
eukprot:GHVR01015840.1.p1 GENE.GHVR01015840.1~~GHVR01015840.1.p1  ORF type:complete len:128 (-),score=13.06 GHVR01015840.1:263-646(-)